MRQAPNLNKLASVSFWGIPRKVSPLTDEEIIAAGMRPGKLCENYVQDDSKSSKNTLRKATFFQKTRHLTINGVSGSGKEEWVEALAHYTRRPLAVFSLKKGLSPAEWITSVGMKDGSTEVNELSLSSATKGATCFRDLSTLSEGDRTALVEDMIEEGYHVTLDENNVAKIIVPAIILFSDYDRAGTEQVEFLRQMTERGRESIVDPVRGGQIPLLQGTRVIMTSNSGVDGDGGRGNVTNQKDASMATRTVAVKVGDPTTAFMEKVIATSQPTLTSVEVKLIVKCLESLRALSLENHVGLEITLRQAESWAALAIEWMNDGLADDLTSALKDTFESIVGHLMDDYNRDSFEGAVDALLKSDVIDENSDTDTTCPIDL